MYNQDNGLLFFFFLHTQNNQNMKRHANWAGVFLDVAYMKIYSNHFLLCKKKPQPLLWIQLYRLPHVAGEETPSFKSKTNNKNNHICLEHMLKQSGNTADKGVFSWLKYKQENSHKCCFFFCCILQYKQDSTEDQETSSQTAYFLLYQ